MKNKHNKHLTAIIQVYVAILSITAVVFFFDFYFLSIALVLGWIMQGVSLEAIMHRKYAHNQYRYKNKFVEILAYGLLLSSGIGRPWDWAYGHRIHHSYTDEPSDPQSPYSIGHLKVFLSAFGSKVKPNDKQLPNMSDLDDYGKRFLIFNNNYYLFYVLYNLFWFIIDPAFALYIIGIPSVFAWISLGVINVFSHLEYKNPRDLPLPIWFWGSNYHQTHHNEPRRTNLGKFDLSYYVIKLIGIENK